VRHAAPRRLELEPPDEAEMTRAPASAAGPVLVRIWWRERDGAVSATPMRDPYRARPAYRFSVENSIYVAANAQRRGIGRALMDRLIAEVGVRAAIG